MGIYICAVRTAKSFAKRDAEGTPVYPITFWERLDSGWESAERQQDRMTNRAEKEAERIPRGVTSIYVVDTTDTKICVGDQVHRFDAPHENWEKFTVCYDTPKYPGEFVGYVRGVRRGVVDIDFNTSNPEETVGVIADCITHKRNRYTGEEHFSVYSGPNYIHTFRNVHKAIEFAKTNEYSKNNYNPTGVAA